MQHLLSFLWLRWRLHVNQLRRGGIVNAIILGILAVGAIGFAVGSFAAFLSIGMFVLSDVSSTVLMYVWDGLVVIFLFAWTTGLLAELQRSESLSLTKFLHLPVSLSSAFLINYVSTLASVTLLLFLPSMFGLLLGLILGRGLTMLWLVPMLAAFLFMVTTLTYQFQGWLATLMDNPRRRRTIIVAATMIFILLCQIPNMVNMLRPWQTQPGKTPDQQENAAAEQQIENTIRLMNLLLAPGWLPAGVEAAASGWPWPIALAIVGPTLIGTASLYRAYRTTLRLYTGQYTSGSGRPVVAPVARRAESQISLLERKLPWLSEQATVVALATFRSLLRAPEGKMILLTPLLFLMIFGSITVAQMGRADLPQAARPFIGAGAMVVVLFSMTQILVNQFGFDRNGFRVYVLSPANRRDILLGKNLAVAPIAFTIAAIAALLVQIVTPMSIDHYLALIPRFVSMYLLFCLLANVLSILAPTRIAPGSFQPTRSPGLVIVLQLAFMCLWPVILVPTWLPVGIDWVVEEMGWLHGIPLDFILSLLECVAIIYLYGFILHWQGVWLQAREQRILQIVMTREE